MIWRTNESNKQTTDQLDLRTKQSTERTNEQANEGTNEPANELTSWQRHEQTSEWTDEPTNERRNEKMKEWKKQKAYLRSYYAKHTPCKHIHSSYWLTPAPWRIPSKPSHWFVPQSGYTSCSPTPSWLASLKRPRFPCSLRKQIK